MTTICNSNNCEQYHNVTKVAVLMMDTDRDDIYCYFTNDNLRLLVFIRRYNEFTPETETYEELEQQQFIHDDNVIIKQQEIDKLLETYKPYGWEFISKDTQYKDYILRVNEHTNVVSHRDNISQDWDYLYNKYQELGLSWSKYIRDAELVTPVIV